MLIIVQSVRKKFPSQVITMTLISMPINIHDLHDSNRHSLGRVLHHSLYHSIRYTLHRDH